MESSMFHLSSRNSQLLSVFADRVLSPRVSHLLLTIRVGRCRKEYVMSLVVRRRSGERSVVGFFQYKSRHHEGNMPTLISNGHRTTNTRLD